MITRRNWLLRCSILINIAVLLYICSHVMIGSGNMTLGPAFVIQEDYAVKQTAMRPHVAAAAMLQGLDVSGNEARSGGGGGSSGSSGNLNVGAEVPNSSGGNTYERQQMVRDDVDPSAPELESNQINERYNPGGGEMDATGNDPEQVAMRQPVSGQQQSKDSQPIAGEDSRFAMASEAPLASAVGSPQIKSTGNEVVYAEAGFANATANDAITQSNSEEHELETRLKLLIHCHDKEYEAQTVQRGDFWVLKNYVRADHGELRCFESVTYTTHADYTFLDNLIPLLERWNAPVSIALHAPGTDFLPTIKAIKYLRDCTPEGALVRQFTTFHIYFSSKHIPKAVPKHSQVMDMPFNCSMPPPFANITANTLYKTQKKLLYPVNVGRNIARDAAMTHFILASDIELYPNPGLTKKFLEMIARNDKTMQRKSPHVFPLSIFEVDGASQVPRDKTELQELLRTGKAIPFHKRVCASCHGVPKSKEWMAANETEELGIFHIGKRVGYFVHWEPIYIGTHDDPHYDERLSWEGKSDKMTQGYALCALDYEFFILDNAFLVHKPGIKVLKKDPKRAMLAAKTNQLIKKIIYPELQVMYGIRKGCAV